VTDGAPYVTKAAPAATQRLMATMAVPEAVPVEA
jgi:hypothetical protein